jgi:hypothetical protein
MPFHQWTWNFGVLRAVPGFLLGMLAFQMRDVLGKCRSRVWMWGLLAAFLVASTLRATAHPAAADHLRPGLGRRGRRRGRPSQAGPAAGWLPGPS